jgi:type I restriction enzyme M protein
MLDNITKKNIDNCRDVLVGKVPDPKSQIEQITLALIYKFMDDMDMESVELGGKPKFFTGDFAKYGWRKLFDPSLGGKDMLELYSEALDTLQTNSNLPELFRNIFKNAYLPYRDPATLKMFLKHIDEFEYSHSEKLGDAFEYLLSVMGSQGDAGQFRTPRHVIDFIAKCLDPKKHETVADPACGTAGFLLSAYKHILTENTDKRPGDKLTPDERKKLADNFVGYDISPDMVRLSLVNMYLHGFATPKIFEYDTLSSEDRWNETFDVILANPPFMTPKGGIRPHKKFGVQANKAEVLFTDYIAEHLNKNGRAGIVVPNGIVATTQTAYKQLRKLLVEDSLIAVISLPAGCFNPYSGVKTSILMLDKSLAKKSDQILFIKVNNDGFDLGAQRREIDKNDLPLALEAFNAYKDSISSGKAFNEEKYSSICTLVEKEKVLENKDIVLSSDRYLEGKVAQTEFEIVKLGEVVEINSKAIDPVKAFGNDTFTYLDIESVQNGTGKVSFDKIIKTAEAPSRARRLVKNGDVIISTVRPNLKAFAYLENLPKNCLVSTGFAVLSENDKVNGKYLYYIVNQDSVVKQMVSMSDKGQYPSITASDVAEIEIPLPPLEIQEQIVKEIDGYQKIIDGAKMVVDNYKPTITINPDWEMVALVDFCDFKRGPFGGSLKKEIFVKEGYLVYEQYHPINDDFTYGRYYVTKEKYQEMSTFAVSENDILISCSGTMGKVAIVPKEHKKGIINQALLRLRPNLQIVNPVFIRIYLEQKAIQSKYFTNQEGAAIQNVMSVSELKQIPFPKLTLEEQEVIVAHIEQEQALVKSNKQLITLFEQKIKDKINEVWGVKEEMVS